MPVIILGGLLLVFISILLNIAFVCMEVRAGRGRRQSDRVLVAARVVFWVGLTYVLAGLMMYLVP